MLASYRTSIMYERGHLRGMKSISPDVIRVYSKIVHMVKASHVLDSPLTIICRFSEKAPTVIKICYWTPNVCS